jgi:hypothetical protein
MQSINENRNNLFFSAVLSRLSIRQDILTRDVLVLPLITIVLV